MSGVWTADKIIALAPDDASAKAGRGLASARKWVTLGQDERAVWGECQGSGSSPYQTQIDLSEPAFKCSCPSRKFPCKHALGLFLLTDADPKSFKQSTPPDWVGKWLEGRSAKAEKKAKKAEDEAAAPPDPEAQAKRAAERAKKLAGGMAELERWLHDLVRQGIATVQQRPEGFFEKCAARMVDAQAPGCARLLREMGAIPATGDGWHARLLDRAGRLHLLVEGYKRVDSLPPPVAADVRSLVGFVQREEDVVRAAEPVKDRWFVLGQRVEEEDRLRVQRTWLRGSTTGRATLVLSFAHVSQPGGLVTSLVVGTAVDATAAYFPGALSLRAVMTDRQGTPGLLESMPGEVTALAAVAKYAAALARNPWLERFPMALTSVVPVRRGEAWAVADGEGRLLPLRRTFGPAWELLALSGGSPVGLFGEWDGESLLPLSACAGGRLVAL
jgi:hypothetical protein